MKFKIRWLPVFIFLASPLFADEELQYDDGSPELGYTNGAL